jgi:hypothetical protein
MEAKGPNSQPKTHPGSGADSDTANPNSQTKKTKSKAKASNMSNVNTLDRFLKKAVDQNQPNPDSPKRKWSGTKSGFTPESKSSNNQISGISTQEINDLLDINDSNDPTVNINAAVGDWSGPGALLPGEEMDTNEAQKEEVQTMEIVDEDKNQDVNAKSYASVASSKMPMAKHGLYIYKINPDGERGDIDGPDFIKIRAAIEEKQFKEILEDRNTPIIKSIFHHNQRIVVTTDDDFTKLWIKGTVADIKTEDGSGIQALTKAELNPGIIATFLVDERLEGFTKSKAQLIKIIQKLNPDLEGKVSLASEVKKVTSPKGKLLIRLAGDKKFKGYVERKDMKLLFMGGTYSIRFSGKKPTHGPVGGLKGAAPATRSAPTVPRMSQDQHQPPVQRKLKEILVDKETFRLLGATQKKNYKHKLKKWGLQSEGFVTTTETILEVGRSLDELVTSQVKQKIGQRQVADVASGIARSTLEDSPKTSLKHDENKQDQTLENQK